MKHFRLFTKVFILFFILAFFTGFTVRDEQNTKSNRITPPFFQQETPWADSVFASLDLEEKIAQLIIVQAYSNRDEEHVKEVAHIIKKYEPGGIIFFQGGPVRQANMTNHFQSLSQVPLFIAIDAEWGLGMRLDSTISYPRQMLLGAIRDNQLIYDMGKDIAEQCRRLGIHINFAPVADVNNNPDNPVINDRSFGEDGQNVSSKALMYMHGLQDEKVIATAKHFPGHGDTDRDSHYSLPVILHDRNRLDSIELYPFKELINSGLGAIMTAHLNIPALDSLSNNPSSLSQTIVSNLLQHEMGFEGLIITDALNMAGAKSYSGEGELEVQAIKAGNDILLMPDNVPKVIKHIKKEVMKGELSPELIDTKCYKILKAKEWAGLHENNHVETRNLLKDLNQTKYKMLKSKLLASSLAVTRNNNVLPVKIIDHQKIASVSLGHDHVNKFQNTIDNYVKCDHFQIPWHAPITDYGLLLDTLNSYDLVIVGIHGTSNKASKKYGVNLNCVDFIGQLAINTNVILNLFANPYSIRMFDHIDEIRGVVVSHKDDVEIQALSAQLIFGGIPATGRIPVSGIKTKLHSGVQTKKIRLEYTTPEQAGFNPDTLRMIDSVVVEAIENKATPGCQVLVARKGKIVWNKSYGHHTYLKRRKVKNTDVYDLASLTKIFATVPSVMRLYDQGKLDIHLTLRDYLPYLDTTNKGDMEIIEVMTHQAGLKPWIPFYLTTLEPLEKDHKMFNRRFSLNYPYKLGRRYYMTKHIKYTDNMYSREKKDLFTTRVADGLYIRNDYRDSIYQKIAQSELLETEGYRYSDLGFYLLYQIIENVTDTLFEQYTTTNFYNGLGAHTIGFHPLKQFTKDEIVPTENDIIFRKQILHGHVHDPGAAMLGGVCGHAGLFGNANDLAKILQLFLNEGTYGGKRYFKKNTVNLFTSCPFCEQDNRRGIGFDKPQIDPEINGTTCDCVSPESYGHTGFTGTMAWADPNGQIIYIFLSNRIHPDQTNPKLIKMNVRTRIQEIIYNAIME